MNKRSSPVARILAAIALVGGFVLVVVIVSLALNGSDSSDTGNSSGGSTTTHEVTVPKNTPKTYVIKSGDTLTAISHATGVPVFQIQRLNPEVDPLSLIAGETLKLR